MQLALAQQQADSDRRLADSDRRLLELQIASDLQIRELTIRAELLAASALVPQPQNLNVVAVGACYNPGKAPLIPSLDGIRFIPRRPAY